MDETQAAALASLKAAADHTDDYVDVQPADLADVLTIPAVAATAEGKALAALAAAAAKSGAVVSLHRRAHLAPLLKAAG